MPWDVTDNYIRSGHRSSGSTCRTITLSAAQGIKGIYCKYGKKWAIQSYLFSRAKGWTVSKAKVWFKRHRKERFEIVLSERLDVIVPGESAKQDAQLHPDFIRMRAIFVRRFGEVVGVQKYVQFVEQNSLNQSKRYHPHAQFRESVELKESFNWAVPLITYLRADKNARYYAVTCLTANISMNNNDYTDPEKMAKAAISMNFMPVNLNHNHHTWFSYPRTRLDWAKFEDMAVEGILRVDNRDRRLQQMLDHDSAIPEKEWVNHPSIEARPIPPHMGGGYHFTGIAMLQKGYALPGDPCSEIQPLFTESIHASLKKEFLVTCRIVDGKIICKEENKLSEKNETANDITTEEDTSQTEETNVTPETETVEVPAEEQISKLTLALEKEKLSHAEDKNDAKSLLRIKEKAVKKLTEDLEELRKTTPKVEVLTKSLKEAQEETVKARTELKERENKIIELEEGLKTSEEAKKRMDADVNRITSANNRLEIDLAKYKKETKNLRNENTKLTNDLSSLTIEKGNLESNNDELRDNSKKLHDQLGKKDGEVKDANIARRKAETALENLTNETKTKMEDIRTEMDNLTRKSGIEGKQITKLNKRIEDLEAQLGITTVEVKVGESTQKLRIK